MLLLAALCQASQGQGSTILHRRPVQTKAESGEEYSIAMPNDSAARSGAAPTRNTVNRSRLGGCISIRRVLCGLLVLGILIFFISAISGTFFGDSLSSHFEGFDVCGHCFPPDAGSAVVGPTCLEYILNSHGDQSLNPDYVIGEGARIASNHLPRCVASAFDHLTDSMFDGRVLRVIRDQLENSGLDPRNVEWNWYWAVLDAVRQRQTLAGSLGQGGHCL